MEQALELEQSLQTILSSYQNLATWKRIFIRILFPKDGLGTFLFTHVHGNINNYEDLLHLHHLINKIGALRFFLLKHILLTLYTKLLPYKRSTLRNTGNFLSLVDHNFSIFPENIKNLIQILKNNNNFTAEIEEFIRSAAGFNFLNNLDTQASSLVLQDLNSIRTAIYLSLLPRFDNLTQLHLEGLNINDEILRDLKPKLSGLKLTSLNLNNNPLSYNSIPTLIELGKGLQTLELKNCNMKPDFIALIEKTIPQCANKKNFTLPLLTLEDTEEKINKARMAVLLLLNAQPLLETLELSLQSYNAAWQTVLEVYLKDNVRLKALSLSCETITEQTKIKRLAPLLSKLRELNLKNKIMLHKFMLYLQEFKFLKVLKLDGEFFDDDFKYLAKKLESPHQIEELDFGHSPLTNNAILHICSMLSNNTSIKAMRYNKYVHSQNQNSINTCLERNRRYSRA